MAKKFLCVSAGLLMLSGAYSIVANNWHQLKAYLLLTNPAVILAANPACNALTPAPCRPEVEDFRKEFGKYDGKMPRGLGETIPTCCLKRYRPDGGVAGVAVLGKFRPMRSRV